MAVPWWTTSRMSPTPAFFVRRRGAPPFRDPYYLPRGESGWMTLRLPRRFSSFPTGKGEKRRERRVMVHSLAKNRPSQSASGGLRPTVVFDGVTDSGRYVHTHIRTYRLRGAGEVYQLVSSSSNPAQIGNAQVSSGPRKKHALG
jgi:hypothetical protein